MHETTRHRHIVANGHDRTSQHPTQKDFSLHFQTSRTITYLSDTYPPMRRHNLTLASTVLLSITLLAAAKPNWTIGPFTRPTHAPLLTPHQTPLFHHPLP